MAIDARRCDGARLWMEKAEESLRVADHGSSSHPDFSVNRAYFASYYAVSALLAYKGFQSVNSSEVPALHRQIVKTGDLSKASRIAYDELRRARQKADYEIGIQWSQQQASEAIAMAERVVTEIRALLVD